MTITVSSVPQRNYSRIRDVGHYIWMNDKTDAIDAVKSMNNPKFRYCDLKIRLIQKEKKTRKIERKIEKPSQTS